MDTDTVHQLCIQGFIAVSLGNGDSGILLCQPLTVIAIGDQKRKGTGLGQCQTWICGCLVALKSGNAADLPNGIHLCPIVIIQVIEGDLQINRIVASGTGENGIHRNAHGDDLVICIPFGQHLAVCQVMGIRTQCGGDRAVEGTNQTLQLYPAAVGIPGNSAQVKDDGALAQRGGAQDPSFAERSYLHVFRGNNARIGQLSVVGAEPHDLSSMGLLGLKDILQMIQPVQMLHIRIIEEIENNVAEGAVGIELVMKCRIGITAPFSIDLGESAGGGEVGQSPLVLMATGFDTQTGIGIDMLLVAHMLFICVRVTGISLHMGHHIFSQLMVTVGYTVESDDSIFVGRTRVVCFGDVGHVGAKIVQQP